MLKREGHIARLIFLYIQGLTDEIQEKELTEWRAESSRHEALFQRMLSGEHIEKSLSRFVKTELFETFTFCERLAGFARRNKETAWDGTCKTGEVVLQGGMCHYIAVVGRRACFILRG